MARYLFGPVSAGFVEQHLNDQVQAGDCLAFAETGPLPFGPTDTWEQFALRLPDGWRPDFIALYLPYRSIPAGIWQAPCPIVGLAGDWNLLWHHYRRVVPRCDLVLVDPLGVETFTRAGHSHVHQANIYGCERAFTEFAYGDGPRDIDVLFVGNCHAAIQRERLGWLGRLAKLSPRFKVHIATGVFADAYRRLMARAKIIFNRSIRGEWNQRAGEALAAGALLLQEEGNREVPALLRNWYECVLYNDDNLEELVEHYLENEDERRAIAEAGNKRLPQLTFATLWQEQVQLLAKALPSLPERAARRGTQSPPSLVDRTWQLLSSSLGKDPTLAEELLQGVKAQPGSAELWHALGIVHVRQGALTDAADAFQTACSRDPRHVVAGLHLAHSLLALKQKDHATEQCQRVLNLLDHTTAMPAFVFAAPIELGGFEPFRVEWEKAGWSNAGLTQAEEVAKLRLVRAACQSLLAYLTGEVAHAYEAYLACPEMADAATALGCALGRRQRPAEAAAYLRKAMTDNPFDSQAARALCQALGEAGQSYSQHELIEERRRLAHVAPSLVSAEPWFTHAASTQAAPRETSGSKLRILWQGDQGALHSLALVNRELCSRLIATGHELSLRLPQKPEPDSAATPLLEALRTRLGQPLSGPAEVEIRHQWPPDFSPPAEGHWVMIQPWEFGSLPRAWLGPMQHLVDEVWVPSHYVRDCFIQSGVPAERVAVVPNGVSPVFFEPAERYPLRTTKRFRFLFVGGTIFRKGIDVLLRAYSLTFTAQDDVCLVIKDMGVGSFYREDGARKELARLQADPQAPAIEYLDQELSPEEMVGLYAACDCLVHPYRGEGFGLPIAEALACGLPVIVTGHGAALEFCRPEHAYLIPARVRHFKDKRVGNLETVDYPWCAEPDPDALRALMREVLENPEEARAKARLGQAFIVEHFTWDRAADQAERRLQRLVQLPIRRLDQASDAPAFAYAQDRAGKVTLTMIVKNEMDNLPACLDSVQDLVDEVVVVDTGSTDQTVAIAEARGAKVFHFPWIDDFAAARNESLQHATGEWIFWLDADDRLDEANRAKLRELFANLPADNVAFSMKCLCLPDPDSQTATVVNHVRLFRKHPTLRWQYRVHEQILPSIRRQGGQARPVDVVINHHGYMDAALHARKQQRNLRLLALEFAQQPDDPFTLFNLGSQLQEQQRWQEALPHLQKSLALSEPGDSITHKLYALIAQCERHLDRPQEALAVCLEGRGHFPQDAEILFQEGVLREELKDYAGAEQCFLDLLSGKDGHQFFSVDLGLRTFKARHNLAVLYRNQGRHAEAESLWRTAIAEEPAFKPAWTGLGELLLEQKRLPELEHLLTDLDPNPQAALEVGVLRGRLHLARKEFGRAKSVFAGTTERFPRALWPKVFQSHALLQEGKDWAAAEEALRGILKLDPNNPEARRNLQVLLQRHGSVSTN